MNRFPYSLGRPLVAALLFGFVLAGCQGGSSGSDAATSGAASDTSGTVQRTSADAPAIRTGRYTLDGAHSNVGFRIRHLGISSVEGTFDDAEATLTFPSQDLADMQARATLPVSSINTGNGDRDGHLRSGDFFNAEQYPEITFESTSVNPTGGGNFEMTGDLTIKDTTKQVTLEGQYLGTAEGPQGNTRAGFEASGEIDRQDFGLTWSQNTPGGELVIGNDVTLRLDVEAMRQGSVQNADTAATAALR